MIKRVVCYIYHNYIKMYIIYDNSIEVVKRSYKELTIDELIKLLNKSLYVRVSLRERGIYDLYEYYQECTLNSGISYKVCDFFNDIWKELGLEVKYNETKGEDRYLGYEYVEKEVEKDD